jgi:hypothetical protein
LQCAAEAARWGLPWQSGLPEVLETDPFRGSAGRRRGRPQKVEAGVWEGKALREGCGPGPVVTVNLVLGPPSENEHDAGQGSWRPGLRP